MRSVWSVGVLLFVGFATVALPGQTREETVLWKTIENSANPDDYRAYLDKYPDGAFAPLAKRRLTAIEADRMSLATHLSWIAERASGSNGGRTDAITAHGCELTTRRTSTFNGQRGGVFYTVSVRSVEVNLLEIVPENEPWVSVKLHVKPDQHITVRHDDGASSMVSFVFLNFKDVATAREASRRLKEAATLCTK